MSNRERRRHGRAHLLWPARLRCGEAAVECVVLNLSLNGAKLRRLGGPPAGGAPLAGEGERVGLDLGERGCFPARVVWRREGKVGLQFDQAPSEIARALAPWTRAGKLRLEG